MKGTLIASLIIIVWAALFTQSVWKLAQNFRAFDPTPGCHNSNACVDRIPGRVVESGATDVTVSYDAGRKRTLIEPDDSDFAAPPDGSTVLVERWRGATIAIVDPSGTVASRTPTGPTRTPTTCSHSRSTSPSASVGAGSRSAGRSRIEIARSWPRISPPRELRQRALAAKGVRKVDGHAAADAASKERGAGRRGLDR